MSKTAIITGGARGIGLAITSRLFSDGCNVAVMGTSKNDEGLKRLNDAGISGERVLYFSGSVADKINREQFLKAVLSKFSFVDILVNNAGIAPKERRDLLEMSEESFDRVLSVNLKGNLGMTQLVARHMCKKSCDGRRGVIVNISSCSAYASSVNRGEYCVSKAGISMLTTLFADRLADDGINVFEVRPGIIATDMTSCVTEKYDKLIDGGLLPIKRWGTPEDVAGVVSLLCDERMAYCTGDIINVDGGFHIQRL